ncbi:cytochrome P450 [Roseateles asaccharophilus]|uniref:Cytochrome P450 n=1 Tax=Roseateles asaccharophilus TaxID=582607 RepID=A0ABU2A9E1_9BURK|nr:cytochrome P450 [Roseateles asaccharophilus]MDR7333818.1 cytochrome P450 [Roseateles asaccharophilus]
MAPTAPYVQSLSGSRDRLRRPAVPVALGAHGPLGPYAAYRDLRSAGPIHWDEAAFNGAWVLTTFDGVQSALKDPRLSAHRTAGWILRRELRASGSGARLSDMQRLFSRALLFADKPRHPQLRALMSAPFQPAGLAAMQRAIVEITAELLDDIDRRTAADATFDFIDAFAKHLPLRVIGKLLGVSVEASDELLASSIDVAGFLGSLSPTQDEASTAAEGMLTLAEHLECVIAQRRFDDQGLVAALLRHHEAGRLESFEELLSQAVMMLFAGLETTRHFLGTGLYWLLQEADRLAIAHAPQRLATAVRELLRWDSPVQYTARRATCAFQLHGVDIQRGDLVLPLLGAANRDPGRYADAESLELGRQVGMPISFGAGPHFCMGAQLTLLEAEHAFSACLKRWPQLQVAAEPVWLSSPLYRGMKSLHLSRGAMSYNCSNS